MSYATGAGDGQQVGYAHVDPASTTPHAMVWYGSADSFVDLHPNLTTLYSGSIIMDTDGGQQVGYAIMKSDGQPRAMLWYGDAASAISLHGFLPGNYTRSEAHGIDARTGNIVGRALNNTTGRFEAVIWKPDSQDQVRLLWKEFDGTGAGRATHYRVMGPESVNHSEFGSYPGWTARRLSVGGDGRSRILWEHTTGRISL